jgi:hypothetical protein
VYHEVGKREPFVIRSTAGISIPPQRTLDTVLEGAGDSVDVTTREMPVPVDRPLAPVIVAAVEQA